ncbi:MAG TPA: hypothetical protein VIX73_35375 [Kofleriaceae bacterium]|jgi:hypothetical protein
MKYLLGLSYVFLIAACAINDSAADPAPTTSDPDAQAPPDPGATGKTESAAGALPEPAVYQTGHTRVTLSSSLTGSPMVQIDGGTDLASYAYAAFYTEVNAPRVTGEVTVNPASGASFVYELFGLSNGTWSGRTLRLQRVPGPEVLQATSTSGNVTCGPLPSGRPTEVTLSFDGVSHTFDVLIGGAPSACTDLPTKFGNIDTNFRVLDYGNQGYGGHVEFTNFALF